MYESDGEREEEKKATNSISSFYALAFVDCAPQAQSCVDCATADYQLACEICQDTSANSQ
jgi:recombinational DNA repair protein RecR